MFTLSSISSGMLFWSVNHTLMDWNSALAVFKIVNEWGATGINWSNCLSGTEVKKTFDSCW